jgi:hypothetical protein
MKQPSHNKDSCSRPSFRGRNTSGDSTSITPVNMANYDASENDPTMINRDATTRRRSSNATKSNTLPPLPLLTVVTPPRKQRLKSSMWSGGTSSTASTPVNTSNNIPSSYIDPSSNSTVRTWQTLLRSNAKIHNLCRRIDISTSSSSFRHLLDCRSDHAVVHIDGDSKEIEITPTNAKMPLPQPKDIRSIPTPSKFWWSTITSPTASAISKSPTSVNTNVTSESTTDSEPSYNITTTKHPSRQQRMVRFHEDLNCIIESELSPQHVKEYRKCMWWSSKDRVRSMKQRDIDLQNILKQNHVRPTEPRVLPVLDHVNEDAVVEMAMDAIGRDSAVGNGGDGPQALSEYCQAVVTMYRYCHECATMATKPNSTSQLPPCQQEQPPLNPNLMQAICLIASSKYRGLERIVCKILQIQKVSSLSDVDVPVSHSIPVSKLPTTLVTTHMEPLMATMFTAVEDTSTTTTLLDHNATTDSTTATIVAHDTNIEVMLHTSPPHTRIPTPLEAKTPTTPKDKVDFDPLHIESTWKNHRHHHNNSSTMSTAMYIRQCVLEYQNQCREKHQSGRRHLCGSCDRKNTIVMNNDEEDCVDHTGVNNHNHINDSTNIEITTTVIPMSPTALEHPNHHSASPVPRDQQVMAMVDSSSLLRQYYSSFPGHDISIVWAQLMAIGDASILLDTNET